MLVVGIYNKFKGLPTVYCFVVSNSPFEFFSKTNFN